MTAGDDWQGVFSDNMSDHYETKELQNGYFTGTSGSPFTGFPDRSYFSNQFYQYHQGNPQAIDPCHFDHSGNEGGGGTTNFMVSSTGNTVNGADYNVSSAPRSEYHMPDITSLSVFGTDFPMSHGLPIQQGSGSFPTGGDVSSGFGSFSSTSEPAAPAMSSSFGSAHTGDQSLGDHDVGFCSINAPANQATTGLGLVGEGWQGNNGTMSPKDLPLERAESVDSESFPDRSPPLLFEHEEDAEDEADDEETAQSVASSGKKSTAPAKSKQRKSLPDKAPRSRKSAPRRKAPEEALKAERDPEPSTPSPPRQKKPRVSPHKVLKSPQTKTPRSARTSAFSTRELRKAKDSQDAQDNQDAHYHENLAISPSSSRSAKDDFLLASKQKGMTYKEIRAAGGFTEAESTLRGRFRTLTKSKEERVRKPEWSDKDIQLLQKAVRAFGRVSETDAVVKVPWKQVAEYIHTRGGSYLFGNATCRKKWDELVMEKVRTE
ncbi:hypothetical protein F5X68DRAFT_273096 [Plectosphaerella plurivora]|uniref:Myb-like domain-containing protein n=1 Tax=Plectosphaerella plurivora TaxID=936078 RepID=A0A9P9AFC5_9PEZI|nr:hypothetical protein F5X68DRAFT_273096 [Plectosphaerella plurivora]